MAPKAIPAAMLSSVSRILKRCKFAAFGCGGPMPRAQVDLGTYICNIRYILFWKQL